MAHGCNLLAGIQEANLVAEIKSVALNDSTSDDVASFMIDVGINSVDAKYYARVLEEDLGVSNTDDLLAVDAAVLIRKRLKQGHVRVLENYKIRFGNTAVGCCAFCFSKAPGT